MPKTSPSMAREVERLVHEFLEDAGVWGIVITDVHATIADDGESLVIRVDYGDGRSSESTFEGYVGISDLDDILLVTIEELTEKGSQVVSSMLTTSTGLRDETRPDPFLPALHRREGKIAPPIWEKNWLPPSPFPSLKPPTA